MLPIGYESTAGVQLLADLDPKGLWPAQVTAIESLETSVKRNHPER